MKIEDYKKMAPLFREYLREYCGMKEREIKYWESYSSYSCNLKPANHFVIEVKKARLAKAKEMVDLLTESSGICY